MYYKHFHFYLSFVVFLVPIGFLITYLLAVLNGHVEAGFPFISDTGANPPESCVFGQILAIGSFFTFVIIYTRYHHVKLVITSETDYSYLKKYNKLSFVVGCITCFGVSLVGNFQEQNVLAVHLIGALGAFGGLAIYDMLQTFISHKLNFALESRKSIFYFRIFLAFLSITFFVLTFVFSFIAAAKFTGDNTQKWKHDEGGYAEHLVSTISEWAMAYTEMIYLLTFFNDFKRVKMQHPTLIDRMIINQ